MSIKKYIISSSVEVIYWVFSIFPLAIKARVLDKVDLLTRLDYHERIYLAVDSYWSYYRRVSCAKEPDTIQWLEQNLRAGDVFYDVGANIGAYSFVAARLMKEGVVVSIEPSFSTYKTLCNNVILNKKELYGIQFYPFGCAVGDSNSFLEFKFSDTKSGAAQHGNERFQATLNVPSFKLNDFIRTFSMPVPTVMKIDVDGPEVAVLLGSTDLLKNKKLRTILVEVEDCTEQEVKTILAKHGFFLASTNKKGKWANLIFSRPI